MFATKRQVVELNEKLEKNLASEDHRIAVRLSDFLKLVQQEFGGTIEELPGGGMRWIDRGSRKCPKCKRYV